jgi:hypothetical protein
MGDVGIGISVSYLKNPFDPHSGTLYVTILTTKKYRLHSNQLTIYNTGSQIRHCPSYAGKSFYSCGNTECRSPSIKWLQTEHSCQWFAAYSFIFDSCKQSDPG